MNREIKFRGKMLDSDDFVYGYYIHSELSNEPFEHKIYCADVNRLVDVKEETIGQFTGLHDKNGKEIYEGDILEIKGFSYKGYCTGVIKKNVVVEFKDYHWSCGHKSLLNLSTWQEVTLEVIGNIYENSELLGGEDG